MSDSEYDENSGFYRYLCQFYDLIYYRYNKFTSFDSVCRNAQAFSAAEMEKFGVSSMITRTNNDAYQIMLFLNVILKSALLTPVMMCVSVMLILQISLQLSYVFINNVFILINNVFILKIAYRLFLSSDACEPAARRQASLGDRSGNPCSRSACSIPWG